MTDVRIQYLGSASDRLLSPNIWANLPITEIQAGRTDGTYFFDDFLKVHTGVTTEMNGDYYVFSEGAGTVLGTAIKGGEMALFATADNEEVGVSLGELTSAPWVISDTAADARLLCFECRIKRSVITDAKGGFFVGLTDEAANANEFMTDSGTDFGDDDIIGFWGDETDDSVGSHVHFIYQIAGQAFVTKIDTVATMVADTYMKLGFKYDPNAPAAKRIKIYADSVEQSTYVTAANIATATFPDAEELTLHSAIKNAHADDFTLTKDWWACGQIG